MSYLSDSLVAEAERVHQLASDDWLEVFVNQIKAGEKPTPMSEFVARAVTSAVLEKLAYELEGSRDVVNWNYLYSLARTVGGN